MMSYVRRPSFTNSAMSTGHRFSLTSCGKKNHDNECDTCCHGFRACKTKKLG